MKIIRNNKIYVQKNDIMFAFNHSNAIPLVIINQFFRGIVIVDDSNRMDFVSFEDKSAIDYFNKLDYIINYDDYKDMFIEELDQKIKELVIRRSKIVNKYNSLSPKKRRQNFDLFNEYEKLEYVLDYLDEFRKSKLGTNHMNIPAEIVDTNRTDVETAKEIDNSSNNGIKRFIKEKILKK